MRVETDPPASCKPLPAARAKGLPWWKRAWKIFWLALCKYLDTDGEQRAASFAYYAFFALFPLVLLFVSVGSVLVDIGLVSLSKREIAGSVVTFVGTYMPMGNEGENAVIKTISGVIESWKGAGIIALLAILWSALGLFHAMVRGVNRAWGTHEYPWWKLPFKNLLMVAIVGSALLLGVVAPAVVNAIEAFTWRHHITYGVTTIVWLFSVAKFLVPTFVLFYGFTMFYKFAPRRRTSWSEVWFAALMVTIALQLLQYLFVLYTKNFYNFNRIYGTFGGVVALLMWIYLSGSVIVFGGCLSAAQADVNGKTQHDVKTVS